MRTTINLNDELLRSAKRRAVSEGTSLRAVVERALRSYLEGGARKPDYRLRIGDRNADGCRPGVRLDDRDTLFDLMEGRD